MSRIRKTLLNARINAIFYGVTILLSFYSRKFFIGNLGNELVGLGATLANILGFLNLAELGIGSAVSFLLYKPLHDNNKEQLQNIISVFGYYYKKIGIFIIGSALVLCLFLPLIFKSSPISLGFIYASFFTFLFSSLLGYFVNYKQLLFTADQKNYVIVGYINTITICKIILQMLVLYYFKGNYYFFLVIEVIFALFQSILISIKIKKEYPWLNSTAKSGRKLKQAYPEILKNTKQIFSHQFAGFILTQTDQLLVFSFTSLSMVTYFSNYTLIIQRITGFLYQLLNSSGAGVGNLIASNDYGNIKRVFGELMVLRYWSAGVIIFCLYILIPSFIKIWLSTEYVLDNNILTIMLINAYILITRQTIDSFLFGYGLFKDVWAPWVEAGLNLSISIFLGYHYGILGIMIGTLISMIIIIAIWKPYFLFKNGFKESIFSYWMSVTKYMSLFILTGYFINYLLSKPIWLNDTVNYYNWITKAILSAMGFGILYGIFLLLTTSSMRSLVGRLTGRIDLFKRLPF